MDRTILHCDMNSFYCSVELLDHPELKGLPVAVAGDPKRRHGIILAKNEVAKSYGIYTPEPVSQALRKCPELYLLEPHHDKYEHYFSEINSIYREYTDMVEPFSIDESWLDVTASKGIFGSGRTIADEIRARIRSNLGLTLSVGVSWNKVFAKMGSEYKKPDATTEITRENYRELLWPLPAADFFFVGRSTAARLADFGISTVGDIARADPEALALMLGQHGTYLYRAVNGLDDSPVRRWGERDAAKSVGHGITFPRDLLGSADVQAAVTELADRVSARLRRYNMKAYGVKVEISDPSFRRRSRQRKLASPFTTAAAIKKESLELIREMGFLDKPIRLLTVTAIELADASREEQLTIFNFGSDDAESIPVAAQGASRRDEKLEQAVDEIRKKFGADSIGYAHKLESDLFNK